MPVFVLCVWHCSKGAVSLSCCVSNLLPPQGMWVRWCPHHPHHHPDHHPLQSHLVQLKEEMFHCCGAAPPPQVQYPCAADSSPRFHGLLLLLTLFFGENKMDWIGWEGGWADPRDEESARVVPGVKLRAQRGWREQLWLLLGAWLAGGVVTSLCPPRNLPPAPLGPLGHFLALALGRLEQPGEGSSCSRSEGTECWEHSKLFSQSLPLPARCWWLPERRKGNLRALAVLGIVLYPSQRTIQGNRATGNWAEQDAVDGKLGADDGSSPSVPWANWSSLHPKRGSGSITPSPGSRCCENKPSTSPLVHFSFLI